MSLEARYAALIAAGEVEPDDPQAAAVARFAGLAERLREHRMARKSSALGWLFGARERRGPPIKGLYIWGDVGRGKTMLMDLFFAAASVERKRRAHFHEFMADVHERAHEVRARQKAGAAPGEEPIRLVADAIAGEAELLCFDEFHVTDIADAMILGRLFARLFEHGVTVVATSNVRPEDLYRDGLNRALFVPTIALLERQMDVMQLAARKDFRLEKLAGAPVWHTPADAAADAALDAAWRHLTGGHPSETRRIAIKGRSIRVPQAAMGVARFAFEELCVAPMSAIDYLRIAHEFHTLVLDHIPVMDFDRRNHARRFIILIDTLYENAVKLVASAEAEPGGLYRAADGFEAREFARTVSRLMEMRSRAYLALPHGGRAGMAITGSTEGIVET